MGLQPMWRGEPSAPGEGRAEPSPLQSALSPFSCRDYPGKSPPFVLSQVFYRCLVMHTVCDRALPTLLRPRRVWLNNFVVRIWGYVETGKPISAITRNILLNLTSNVV